MVGTYSITQCLRQCLLPHHAFESRRTILSCRYDIITHNTQLTRKGTKKNTHTQVKREIYLRKKIDIIYLIRGLVRTQARLKVKY